MCNLVVVGHRNSKHIHSCTLSQASIGKDMCSFLERTELYVRFWTKA